MKQLTCEMCGSFDLVKEGGLFICQSCGCKYSVEEAKKLMIDGPVDVTGSTVKVDNSAFVEKYLQNAHRAMEKEDWDEVEKYYNMVEQNDPTNIEAIFYSAYGKAKGFLLEENIYKRQAAFKVLTNSVSILDDNYDITKEAELKDILIKITRDIIKMKGSSFVYTEKTTTQNGITSRTDNKNETYALFEALISEMMETLSNITEKFPENERANVIYLYELRLELSEASRNGRKEESLIYRSLNIAKEIEKLAGPSSGKYSSEYYLSLLKDKEKAKRKSSILFVIVFCVIDVFLLIQAITINTPILYGVFLWCLICTAITLLILKFKSK